MEWSITYESNSFFSGNKKESFTLLFEASVKKNLLTETVWWSLSYHLKEVDGDFEWERFSRSVQE